MVIDGLTVQEVTDSLVFVANPLPLLKSPLNSQCYLYKFHFRPITSNSIKRHLMCLVNKASMFLPSFVFEKSSTGASRTGKGKEGIRDV